MVQYLGFDEWIAVLPDVIKNDFHFDGDVEIVPEAWRKYYDQGLSPFDAVKTDLAIAEPVG